MSVWRLFDSALLVVVSNATHYERELPYLPNNVRTELAKIMARRGMLHAGNMPLVLHGAILSLDMSECAVGSQELDLLWRLCPRLKTLDLGQRRGSRDTATSQALSQLFSHLPSLLSLNLQSCVLVDHSSLLTLTFSCPLLTMLTLTRCHMVTDCSVVAMANRLHYLQVLSLARTQISSKALISLSKGVSAKILKELDISHCVNVTDEGLSSLLSLCPRLSILVFHGCPLLTSRARNMVSGLRLKQVTWTIY